MTDLKKPELKYPSLCHAASEAQTAKEAAPHGSALWKQLLGMRSGPVKERQAVAQIEASMGPSYGCRIEIIPLWDGPVVITLRRPEGVEERPITESERAAIAAALQEAGYDAELQAELCVEAFVAWYEENIYDLVRSKVYYNNRTLLTVGFQAGWEAHKAAK